MQGGSESRPAWAVFTDGSCWAGDRIGGWGWIAFNLDGSTAQGEGAAKDTTISRMELIAPLRFLEWLLEKDGPSLVLVNSDSEFVVKGAMDRSRARNKHRDLWYALDNAVNAHDEVIFEHVRGHAESYYNLWADRLAGEARKRLRDEQVIR